MVIDSIFVCYSQFHNENKLELINLEIHKLIDARKFIRTRMLTHKFMDPETCITLESVLNISYLISTIYPLINT